MIETLLTIIVCAILGALGGLAMGPLEAWWARRRERRTLVSEDNWLAHCHIEPLPASRNSDKVSGISDGSGEQK